MISCDKIAERVLELQVFRVGPLYLCVSVVNPPFRTADCELKTPRALRSLIGNEEFVPLRSVRHTRGHGQWLQ